MQFSVLCISNCVWNVDPSKTLSFFQVLFISMKWKSTAGSPSLVSNRSNLLDPSKFLDIYFHGNFFHRKREDMKAFSPLSHSFPPTKLYKISLCKKPDGLLLVNDIILYKATPAQGCIFSV